MKKRHAMSKQLGVISAAAGAVVLGATSSADAGLKVFDHRASSLFSITDYWLWDQTMILMNVKTGDFQYIVEQGGNGGETDGVNDVIRYNQDGMVDTNLIPDTDRTDDTVWLTHRDMVPPGKSGAADGVVFETPTGGAGGRRDAGLDGNVYSPGRIDGSNPNTWSPHDWYWAHQDYDHDGDPGTPNAATNGLLYPADPALGESLHPFAVDGTLSYNDSSPTGFTGAVTHGFGGLGHGSGSWFWVEDPDGGRSFSLPFKLEEGDGTHYGWVAMTHNTSRNRVWVSGWAYQTTPGVAAELTWVGDPDGVLGDFDGDDDVDADDIDILCANMGGDVATYDMDGDLDVDEDDMIYHIENLVELQDGSGRVGTMRGDFNLDGFVNATDLAIMKPNFGLSGMLYSDGNANCDTVINGTDLAVLSANIGFAAPTGAIPEPATLSVLALGAAGIASRRRRKS